MAKTAIIITSDQHINSTLALCPPRVQLDDGGSYIASPTQRWLWQMWNEYIEWARDASAGYKPIAVFNGDLGELDTKKRSNQLVSMNKATVLNMITEALEPLTSWVDANYFIRGTPAHVGKSSWLEEVAADYTNTVWQSKGIKSHYQVRLNADKVRVDIAHHSNMGSLRRTAKNAANTLAHDTMEDYIFDLHAQIPNLVIRSHNHRWADSGDNFDTRAVLIPCWAAANEYLFRLGKYNGRGDVGGVVVLCDNGEFEVRKFKREPKRGNVWAMQA